MTLPRRLHGFAFKVWAQVLRRVFGEYVSAADAAEVVGGAFVAVIAAGRILNADFHLADGVNLNVRMVAKEWDAGHFKFH